MNVRTKVEIKSTKHSPTLNRLVSQESKEFFACKVFKFNLFPVAIG